MNWHEYFIHDAEAGVLIWRQRSQSLFPSKHRYLIWTSRFGGKAAGTKASGRVVIMLDRKRYLAHRIIWEMHHGPIPKGMVIDHKDGNPFNNKLCNLRKATLSQNAMNSKMPSHNTSGYKGVSLHKKTGKWRAVIKAMGRHIHLGSFETKKDASDAYLAAAILYFKEFARP